MSTLVANVHLVGIGNVGSDLVEILRARADHLEREEGVRLRVVSITNRGGSWFDAGGLDLEGFRRGRQAAGPVAVRRTEPGPSILVDATASLDSSAYVDALSSGCSVVTANKLPFVEPEARHRALMRAARASAGGLFFETTVGADLPVLEPIANRLRSGDDAVLGEGSLSGTLGFLSDEVTRGVPFEAALEVARVRGYTEPDPREDLSGRDVARKALILARLCGVTAELDDVALTPFPSGDEEVRRLLGARPGALLRYLARVDVAKGTLSVGPELVDRDHPAAHLRGTEAMVAVTTVRSGGCPLVVRGPGAGGFVTASGLLTDILRAARRAAVPIPRGRLASTARHDQVVQAG